MIDVIARIDKLKRVGRWQATIYVGTTVVARKDFSVPKNARLLMQEPGLAGFFEVRGK